MCNNTYGVTVLDVLDRAKPKQGRQKKLSGEGGYAFVSGQRQRIPETHKAANIGMTSAACSSASCRELEAAQRAADVELSELHVCSQHSYIAR